jgi:two-component system response regulator HydG
VKVDVRIIAATNQDLRRAIVEKRFREDLFYRLNVVPLRIPPLRERREDIPLLARHFLERNLRRSGGTKRWTVDALAHLLEHNWPGNVRELENVVAQAAALSEGPEIRVGDVAFGPEALGRGAGGEGVSLAEAVEAAERRTIEAALVRCAGDHGRVAKELSISATTLWRKMKRLGIEGGATPPES